MGDALRRYGRVLLGSRLALWIAFVIVHLGLGLINLYSNSNPMGDVRQVYPDWIAEGLTQHYWVGIDAAWVYPIVAMVPMLAAHVFGYALYPNTWLSMVFLLDAVALATLTGWGRRARHLTAGWWWVAFLALLGPIAVSRIDSPSIALAMIGALVIGTYPMLAGVLVTLATWIKVWPAALIAAMFIALRQRLTVLVSAVVTSVIVIVIAVALGSGANVFSFITQQTGRGLQVEAPVSSIWLWRALFGDRQSSVFYDQDILTFGVKGPGADVASNLMTPLMVVAAVVVAVLGIVAVRRRVRPETLLPLLSLGFVVTLITFNKVLSPQYIGWLAVPMVLALVSGREARRWMRSQFGIVLAIAGLTQLVYPYFYGALVISVDPLLVIVLTVRNILLIVLWVVTVERLWAMARSGAVEGPHTVVPGQPLGASSETAATWPGAPSRAEGAR